MATDKLAIVSEAYASFGRGDIDGFFKHFDANARLVEAPSLPYGGVHVGKEAGTKALMAIGEAWTDIKFDITEIIAGEKMVCAYGAFSATGRTSGKSVTMPLAEIWEFEGNTVKAVTPIYFDTAEAVAALA